MSRKISRVSAGELLTMTDVERRRPCYHADIDSRRHERLDAINQPMKDIP